MRHTTAIIALSMLAAAGWGFGLHPGAAAPPETHAGAALVALMTFAVAVMIEPRR